MYVKVVFINFKRCVIKLNNYEVGLIDEVMNKDFSITIDMCFNIIS